MSLVSHPHVPTQGNALGMSKQDHKITNRERESTRLITRRRLDCGSRMNAGPCLSRRYPSTSIPIALAEDGRACQIPHVPMRSSMRCGRAASGKRQRPAVMNCATSPLAPISSRSSHAVPSGLANSLLVAWGDGCVAGTTSSLRDVRLHTLVQSRCTISLRLSR